MNTIWKKSFAAVTTAVIVISVYFAAGVLLFANALYNEINTRNMEDTVRTLGGLAEGSLFDEGREADAAEWVFRFDGSGPYRVTLIRRNGTVIADTYQKSAVMENHLDRPEFQAALSGNLGKAHRQSATLGQEYIYSALGIPGADGETAGVLRLSRIVPSFSGRLLNSALPFIFCGFILILGCCVELYRFSRSLSRSIEKKLDDELLAKTGELLLRTEEAETESSLREAILNSMTEGVIALDRDLRVILVNPRVCFFFGSEGGKGMTLLEFSGSTELEETARRVLEERKSVELLLKRHARGSEQRFRVFAALLGAGGGGVVMVLDDISRLVRLEQVRKDFAANVSHELRTPIQLIKGFAENLLNSSLDDKDQIRRFTEIIAKNAQNMENLTNDLLILVSLEDDNTAKPPMEITPMAPLITEAAGMVEIAAKKKNIVVETLCPPSLQARVHGSFIVQALVNLLDNGIKYSESGSSLQVRVFTENNSLIIEVKDEGIGIPAEHMERIFERFYRVDRARSREAGGTGLGLAIVRHIALLHGGTVEAESHAGEGSLFRLHLPLG
ncbi:MAG: PAS domain-containing protein [Treponema sp.]|jgi:two-component system phosphate regulon sensor histidine kinase PhoR|nr:PAS domain-containing protein [Treponema sp.]